MEPFAETQILANWSNLNMDEMVEGFPSSSAGKESACNVGDLGSIPRWKDPLEEGMATHSSILAWRVPWTEEPGGLQSMRSQSQTRLSD